jgi:hypothetical protein
MKKATKTKKPEVVIVRQKYISLDAAIALEGLSRKQISELQHDHGLKVYDVLGTLVLLEDELHAAMSRAKKEAVL